MAKISANGCEKVAALTIEHPDGSRRKRYVLRSDGAILRGVDTKLHTYEGKPYWYRGNSSILPNNKPVRAGTARTEAIVERFMAIVRLRQQAEAKGWQVVTWKAEYHAPQAV